MRDASDAGQFLLATLPPSKRQVRLALGIILALIVAVFAIAPFANVQLPQVGALYPVLLSVTIINDLITSALLFSQFFVIGRTALFVLAISYLLTGLMTIPFMLTFPGAFSPTGLLGAGLQSASYIGALYRFGASMGVIAYTLMRNAESTTRLSERSPLAVILLSVAAVIATVCGLTWFATAKEALLPVIFVDSAHPNGAARAIQSVILMSANVIALTLLWRRWHSVLDLWLIVMCCTWLLIQLTSNILAGSRFSVGWYGARCFEVIATSLVLGALLTETTALYVKLGRSLVKERGSRDVRQVAMDAMAAAIAHEIRQPLAAIATNGYAALRWMAKPDLDEVRASIERIVSSAHRASEVIEGLRSLFRKGNIHGPAWLDVNELIREVLTTVDADLRTQRISVSTELRQSLPQLLASRAQLEEVFVNLIMNAIEAMHSVTDRARLLRITSDIVRESSTVLVTIEDTGRGIDSKDKERIFEPFFTTKSEGTGIGLAICRAIVETHGGSLRASPNNPYGAIFHVALPGGNSP